MRDVLLGDIESQVLLVGDVDEAIDQLLWSLQQVDSVHEHIDLFHVLPHVDLLFDRAGIDFAGLHAQTLVFLLLRVLLIGEEHGRVLVTCAAILKILEPLPENILGIDSIPHAQMVDEINILIVAIGVDLLLTCAQIHFPLMLLLVILSELGHVSSDIDYQLGHLIFICFV